MQPISLILTDSKIIFSIQPHLNFEHYKETHNKRFSSRHYCPMESCNSSYSRKNVLAAHLRKAHEVPEDDLVEHTSHDEPLTIDCLLCGADLTSLSTGRLSFYSTLNFSVHLRNLIIVFFSWKKWALWKSSPVRSPLLPICWTIYKRAAWCPTASTSSQFNRLKSKLRDWADRSRAEAILLRNRVRLLWLLPLLLRINSLFCIVHLLIGLFSLSLSVGCMRDELLSWLNWGSLRPTPALETKKTEYSSRWILHERDLVEVEEAVEVCVIGRRWCTY